jgi:hypothetical protein
MVPKGTFRVQKNSPLEPTLINLNPVYVISVTTILVFFPYFETTNERKNKIYGGVA